MVPKSFFHANYLFFLSAVNFSQGVVFLVLLLLFISPFGSLTRASFFYLVYSFSFSGLLSLDCVCVCGAHFFVCSFLVKTHFLFFLIFKILFFLFSHTLFFVVLLFRILLLVWFGIFWRVCILHEHCMNI